jgi:hypothetical protein
MAGARLGAVERFVSEALQAWLKERDKDVKPGDPVREGPPYPYVSGDESAARASREQGTPEKSQRQLVRRLKRFQYPYVAPHPYAVKIRSGKSFYRHVRSLGLLNFLLEPPFLWEVRKAWFFHRHYELEKRRRDRKKSQHGYPLAFHREMMLAIASHLGRISKIAREHRVPRKWFVGYYAQTLKQLLSEASVTYPELLRWFKPNSQLRPHSLDVESRLDVFDAITAEFARKKIKNNTLAYQLTALICSPENCIATHTLDPSPDLVRRNISDR